MLRSPTAAALLYSLRAQGGLLGLPYILEEEIKRHALELGVRARDTVEAGLDDLRRLLGSAPSPTMPGEVALRGAAERRFAELEPMLHRVDFDFEQATDALTRVLDEIPPNGPKNQQYKDTLLWVAVLRLAVDFDVVFTTADKGFFADRDPAKGLEAELLIDLADRGVTVTAVGELARAAVLLRATQPAVDLEALTSVIDVAVAPLVDDAATPSDFHRGRRIGSHLEVFATERPDTLAVSFTITYDLDDRRAPGRGLPQAIATGDCLVVDRETVVELRPDRVDLDWIEPSGEAGHRGHVYASASMHLGERHEPWTVRTPLDGR